jgi:predicted ester cyclase
LAAGKGVAIRSLLKSESAMTNSVPERRERRDFLDRVVRVSVAVSSFAFVGSAAGAEALPVPDSAVVDHSISISQRDAMTLAARRYYAFWNTGDVAFANAALASNFVDRTLPAGRPQGPEGPVFASRSFRAAIPDLHVEVEEMMVVGDRVIGRLRFMGHFTGTFGSGTGARQGDGRPIDFIATDIYRVANGRIAENWHLEDNLTFLQQIGALSK